MNFNKILTLNKNNRGYISLMFFNSFKANYKYTLMFSSIFTGEKVFIDNNMKKITGDWKIISRL